MKRLFALISIIILLFGLYGCDFTFDLFDIFPSIVQDDNKPIEEEPIEEEPIEEEPIEEEPVEEEPVEEEPVEEEPVEEEPENKIAENGFYTSKDEVALYIYIYGKLPENYRTKSQVDGHISNYWTKENQLSIGGDRFYNREGLLPSEQGRIYYEADINYKGASNRGSERIVFSNDGLIFYTQNHYNSFVEYNKETKAWI